LCCEHWNIKLNEGKNQAIFSPENFRIPDDVLQINGGDMLLVNKVTYLGVTFDMRMTWSLLIERTVAKALLTYVRTYPLFKIARLDTDIKLTLYKALVSSVMTYALSHLGACGGRSTLEIAAPAEQSTPRYWKP
jgi:hypothetical protein